MSSLTLVDMAGRSEKMAKRKKWAKIKDEAPKDEAPAESAPKSKAAKLYDKKKG